MSIAEHTSRATQKHVDRFPDEGERKVLAESARYARQVDEVCGRLAPAMKEWYGAAVARWRDEDPYAAQALRRSMPRLLLLLLAYLAAAIAIAGYFTRTSRAPLEVLIPVTMVSALVAAALYLLAVLVPRPRFPATREISFGGWVLLVLCAVPTWIGGYFSRAFAPELGHWVVWGVVAAAAVLVLSLIANLSRIGRNRARVVAGDARAVEFREERAAKVAELQEEGERAMREAFDALPEKEREALTRAGEALLAGYRERDISYEPGPIPGSRSLACELDRASS